MHASIIEPRGPRPADITMNDMPNELLRETFMWINFYVNETMWTPEYDRHRRNSERVKTLCSLCLTSKRFREVAEPLLYHTFVTADMDTTLPAFLRRVIEQPRFALELRYLDIGILQGEELSGDSQPPLSKDDFAVLKAAAEKIDYPRKGAWIEALSKGLADAELALLLVHTPNVERINMEIGYQNEEELYTWAMIQQADPTVTNPTVHGFSALKSISVAHGDTENGLELGFLIDFMRLSSLREIVGNACSWSFDDGTYNQPPPPQWPRDISNVENMSFTFSDFSDAALANLIGACKALKTFECHWGDAVVGTTEFQLPGLGRALMLQKDSLRTLLLDVSECYAVIYGNMPCPVGMGSLRDLRTLTKLEISVVLLTGKEDMSAEGELKRVNLAKILPPSLEELILLDPVGYDDFSPFMDDLCMGVDEYLPALRLIDTKQLLRLPEFMRDKWQAHFQDTKVDFAFGNKD
ncbi:hypothetical protein W97_05701 [Coniosporium apollinis CBS 100218]|uniref:Leucine-rich repeat domain-containing protein n=1 Tax=Coniosporium apollinis (strain CBS 100218) TaxID=1168221 RepID=R7YWT6_CONA1|nr:uncharacterized protein W97_05701 [Coniosporium apollinis CBS 100218]EON66308.1 hypothetical protein W97_05701 [Coniosporium apollinis CBS 100218]